MQGYCKHKIKIMLLCKWCCIREQINLTSDSSVPNSVNTHKVILPLLHPG